MMRAVLLLITILLFGVLVSAQKLTTPKLLGQLEGNGDDLSEFFAHQIIEPTHFALEENTGGRLIIRVCSADEFTDALVKSPVNPVAEILFGSLVPTEKIFIAKSSACVKTVGLVFNQYWFVPENSKLEYDEIISASNISYKTIDVDDYDNERRKYKRTNIEESRFAENITEFINELKNNPEAKGYIVYNSDNKTMKRNIEKVKALLGKENISLKRVKTLRKIRMTYAENGEIGEIIEEKRYFPFLELVAIKK